MEATLKIVNSNDIMDMAIDFRDIYLKQREMSNQIKEIEQKELDKRAFYHF